MWNQAKNWAGIDLTIGREMVQLVVMDGAIFLNLIPPFKLMSQPSPLVVKSLNQEITEGSPNYAQRRWNTVFLLTYVYN